MALPGQAPQGAQPPQGQPPQGQAPQGGGQDKAKAFSDMIIQTDHALMQIASVLQQINPQAAQAMGQVQKQFESIIQALTKQGSPQGQPQGGQMPQQGQAPMETSGKPMQQAY